MKYGNIIKIEFLKNIQYTTPCLLNHLFNIRFKKMSLCQRMFLQGVNVRVFKDDRLCQFFSKTHTYNPTYYFVQDDIHKKISKIDWCEKWNQQGQVLPNFFQHFEDFLWETKFLETTLIHQQIKLYLFDGLDGKFNISNLPMYCIIVNLNRKINKYLYDLQEV